MKLVHTLLFFLRENTLDDDLARAEKCLKSLEKSRYKTIIIYNQGFWDNIQLENYLKSFRLDYLIIGTGVNVGIVAGRQNCFEKTWNNFLNAQFVSELHLDMVFTHYWEDPLVEYLSIHDEPVIGSGIVDKHGRMEFLNTIASTPPINLSEMDDYLNRLKTDSIVHGFTHPCVHNLDILKKINGLDTNFLKGKQAFEDDSLLLGYHYFYGTRANWKPKVNYNTVVFHEIGGQRFDLTDSVMINFEGLVRQYGAMGLKQLACLHKNDWSVMFFTEQLNAIRGQASQH